MTCVIIFSPPLPSPPLPTLSSPLLPPHLPHRTKTCSARTETFSASPLASAPKTQSRPSMLLLLPMLRRWQLCCCSPQASAGCCVILRDSVVACVQCGYVSLHAWVDSLFHLDRRHAAPSHFQANSTALSSSARAQSQVPAPCYFVWTTNLPHLSSSPYLSDTVGWLQRILRLFYSTRCLWLILPSKRSKNHRR